MKLYLEKNQFSESIKIYSKQYLFKFNKGDYFRRVHMIRCNNNNYYGCFIHEGKNLKKLFVKLAKLNGVSLCFSS